MRIRIIFELNNRGACVPFHHQYLIAELIEELKIEAGSEYMDFNTYTFSGLKGQTKVGKTGLHFFSNKVTLVLSSPNKDFIDKILSSLFKRKMILLSDLELVPEYVESEMDPILNNVVKYICISPMILTPPDIDEVLIKDFVNPFDDLFSDLLYESTMLRMEKTGWYTPEEIASFFKFQVVPDKVYLSKIQQNSKKFSRIYPTHDNGRNFELRGYTLPFTLYAETKVQEFIFTCGMGEFAHKGFGMTDLANVNPIGRTMPYRVKED